jgi:hypothetical protein
VIPPARTRLTSPARTRHRLALPAVAMAVVILGAGLTLVATARPSGSPATTRPAPSVPPATLVAPASQGQPRLPQVSLTGLQWSDFYGVELPYSAQAGPRDTRGGLAAGFARSPLGALLAAVNIGVRANAQWGPAIFGPEIRSHVTGPGAAALLVGCQASYDQASQSEHVTGGQPLGDVDVAEEAFRWVAYTPAAAVIDLVSAGPGSQGTIVRAATRLKILWYRTDWVLVAPQGGDWRNSASALASLAGYTVFPGQG